MNRLTIAWSLDAKSDVRSIDRDAALEILRCIDRYLATRNGDLKRLKAPLIGFLLRCGDYRIFFKLVGNTGISVTRVAHRRYAYR